MEGDVWPQAKQKRLSTWDTPMSSPMAIQTRSNVQSLGEKHAELTCNGHRYIRVLITA